MLILFRIPSRVRGLGLFEDLFALLLPSSSSTSLLMETTSHKCADRREAEHGGALAANAQKKRKHRRFSFKVLYRISGVSTVQDRLS